MENTKTTLNPVQLYLLEMFNYCSTEASLIELKNLLAEYYAKKTQEEADRLWNEGVLDQTSIESLLNQHLRTPYAPQK